MTQPVRPSLPGKWDPRGAATAGVTSHAHGTHSHPSSYSGSAGQEMPPPDPRAGSSLPREQASLSLSVPWGQSGPRTSECCWWQSTASKKATIHSPV